MKTLCIYAYFETDEVSKNTLRFFIKNALPNHEHVHFIFVINGFTCTVEELVESDNVKILKRENKGHDFGGYQAVIDIIKSTETETPFDSFDYFFFINNSAAGPFLPAYTKYLDIQPSWLEPFYAKFKKNSNVRIVGPTINIDRHPDGMRPHVQTYAFMMDRIALEYILTLNLWNQIYSTKWDLILKVEVGQSTAILSKPDCEWTISSFVDEYDNFDYRKCSYDPNASSNDGKGDIMAAGKRCFGRDIHPFEIIFTKGNREIANVQPYMSSICNKRLLVIIPGFGDPKWDEKVDILRKNMDAIERPWVWSVDYIICQYTPVSIRKLPNDLISKPNVRVIECSGVLGNNILKHVPPTIVKNGNYNHVMILLDDVLIDKKTIHWEQMIIMQSKLEFDIISPTLAKREMSHWEYMSIPLTQLPDKELIIRIMRRCELFCYLMTPKSYGIWYSHLDIENPWLWGMDLILNTCFGLRIGMFQQMKMHHMYSNHTSESSDERRKEIVKYLSLYNTTQTEQNAYISDIGHIYDGV